MCVFLFYLGRSTSVATVILCLDCYYIQSTQMVGAFYLANFDALFFFPPNRVVSTFISKYILFLFRFVFVVCSISAAPLLCFGLSLSYTFLLRLIFLVVYAYHRFFSRQILSSFSICQFL